MTTVRTSSELTLTDLFAGAGGSSTGAAQIPGVQVKVASNHWQLRTIAAPIDRPRRTMTTRAETGLVQPFLTQFRDRVRDLDPEAAAFPTIVGDGANHGLVRPFIAELRGGGSTARPADHPLATVTASGFHHGLVVRQNGTEGNLAWASTPAHEAFRTLTTKGHRAVLTPGDIAAADAQVDDCEFRMLEPTETAAGMAFPGDYRWQGTRRERQKLAGNAVTPPAARDLIGCAVEALTGETPSN